MKTRQFSEDQIIKLLQDAKKGDKPVEELCRDLGCSTASYYTWKKKYGDTTPDEAKRRLGQNSTRMGLGRFVAWRRRTLVSCGSSVSSAWRLTP
ncbi:transposase [Deinococcus terrestris]|uniref:transposase n=1 Tax=Deinococcus terrestris TaxID=2651870 RepID=UPI00188418A5|nr:transposase [Deinococcus terrestris]